LITTPSEVVIASPAGAAHGAAAAIVEQLASAARRAMPTPAHAPHRQSAAMIGGEKRGR
jgi:hypothetical protein